MQTGEPLKRSFHLRERTLVSKIIILSIYKKRKLLVMWHMKHWVTLAHTTLMYCSTDAHNTEDITYWKQTQVWIRHMQPLKPMVLVRATLTTYGADTCSTYNLRYWHLQHLQPTVLTLAALTTYGTDKSNTYNLRYWHMQHLQPRVLTHANTV